jgi:hypothetical protein
MIVPDIRAKAMALTFLAGDEVPSHFSQQGVGKVFEVIDHDGIIMLFDLPYEAVRWARQSHDLGVAKRLPGSREWIEQFYSAE